MILSPVWRTDAREDRVSKLESSNTADPPRITLDVFSCFPLFKKPAFASIAACVKTNERRGVQRSFSHWRAHEALWRGSGFGERVRSSGPLTQCMHAFWTWHTHALQSKFNWHNYRSFLLNRTHWLESNTILEFNKQLDSIEQNSFTCDTSEV